MDQRMNARGTYRKAPRETTTVVLRKRLGAPDAAQRSLAVQQSRDPWIAVWTRDGDHPLAAPTFENRLRIRSNKVSQTSR
jgi:hypothetical protein